MTDVSRNDKKEKSFLSKLNIAFTIFCIVFLTLKFTGLLEPILNYFK
ncbi:hypothetical protein B0I26_1193 [Anoxybacillus vitaminiphilus]|uniref:Uncharacterized protein n=1 Tax=Paranoxybacillus vitaminiphilus TaxID=581036 RepID=A0A327Y3N8_9BACL|nr:hypothetical protein B0I26_1193 [Anoxybacillus vitaminiphilus]